MKKIHTNHEEMFEVDKEEERVDGTRYFVYRNIEGGYYLLVSQRENTILKIRVPKGEESALKDIVKGTGY